MSEKLHIEQDHTPSPQESLETLNERMEVLRGVIDEFNTEIRPVLQEYHNSSKVVFNQERGYDDTLKRKAFGALVAKLGSFESHLNAMFELFEKQDGGAGLNNLLTSVREVQKCLIAAPDVRYNMEAQINTHGGKENLSAGFSDTFEHTQEAILQLQSTIRGIDSALIFMHPTKVYTQ